MAYGHGEGCHRAHNVTVNCRRVGDWRSPLRTPPCLPLIGIPSSVRGNAPSLVLAESASVVSLQLTYTGQKKCCSAKMQT